MQSQLQISVPGGHLWASERHDMQGTRWIPASGPAGPQIAWKGLVPGGPSGGPVVTSDGSVIVAALDKFLISFNANGAQQWQFIPQGGREATSGPVVASNGTIYYSRVDTMQAVSPQGESLWSMYAADGYFDYPPVLSAGESYFFLKNAALAASSGAPLDLQGLPLSPSSQGQFTDPFLFIGADSRTYMRTAHEVIGWRTTKTGVEVSPPITWNYQG